MKEGETSRVLRSHERARESYDRMSRRYDAIAGWSEARLRARGLEGLAAAEGETVLELGCGTGHALEELARAVGASGRVHGIDLSPGMVEVARGRLGEAGLSDRVDLGCGDATSLSQGEGSMDAVFMSFTLELFDSPEIPVVLGECLRVLRSGGRICVVALSKEKETVASRLYEWLHARFPDTIDCRPIFARRSLEEAGFLISEATAFPWWGLSVEIVVARKP